MLLHVIAQSLFVVSAGASQGQDTVILKEVSRSPAPPPAVEGDIQGFPAASVLSGSRVVFTDPRGRRLIEWDLASGEFGVVAREGIGVPGSVVSTADGLVAFSVSPPELFFLDDSYVVQRRVRLSETVWSPKSLLVRDDGSVIVSGGVKDRGGEYHLFDTEGTLVRSYLADFPRPSNPLVRRSISGGGIYVDRLRRRTVVSLAAPHTIGVLEEMESGGPPWVADSVLVPKVDDTFLQVSEERGMRRFTPNWDFRRSRALLPVRDSTILFNIVVDKAERMTIWEAYDLDTGERIGRTEVREALDPLLAWNDTVLAVADQWSEQARIVLIEVSVPKKR